MANNKCKSCGSTEIDIDPARGDAVCTSCGSVLEDSVIVSEIQFEENAHGGNSAIGHFVSSESHGGASSFGSNFHAGLGRESREITLSNAKRAITNVAQQLRLNQHCIDTAHNFYKMALIRNLTKGRKNTHVVAACLYITCRVEGTPHLLIDFSDVLQICVYELGRTYLRLSQALCINIPSMDPCLYILRFAHRLEFGDKTHEVSMTALRLVQRMKRDFIHTGRRPSGLCGAALLMAARLHEFNRTVGDIVKIVKVHESTLRKRLLEFGETPSSALTLEEFMTVDLEEEQDPPSFKAARKKDKDRLQRMMEEVSYATKFNELQHEIETLLDTKKLGMKRKKDRILGDDEEQEAETFILESTLGVIGGCLEDDSIPSQKEECSKGLGPDIASMGLATAMEQAPTADTATTSTQDSINEDIDLAGLDEDEIDSYIMTESEAKYKDSLWNKVNAEYLKEQKEKEERLAKEKEEGKPEKKKRRSKKTVKTAGIASTPGEAIEKMLQTKRISSKINYDVLRSLTAKDSESSRKEGPARSLPEGLKLEPRQNSILGPSRVSSRTAVSLSRLAAANKRAVHTLPSASTLSHCIKSDRAHGANSAKSALAEAKGEPCSELVAESQLEEEPEEEEEEEEPDTSEMSLAEMLNQHRDDDMYGGDYDDDY